MYISVFYVFFNPFSIKKIGKYVDLDGEIFFSIKSGTLYKNMTKEKGFIRVNSSPWVEGQLGNTAQLELDFLFLFLIFWVLSKNKKKTWGFLIFKKN